MSTPENWIICIDATTFDLGTNRVESNQTVSELRDLPLEGLIVGLSTGSTDPPTRTLLGGCVTRGRRGAGPDYLFSRVRVGLQLICQNTHLTRPEGLGFTSGSHMEGSDLTMYEELDKKAQVQMNKQLSGWRLVVGNVFREPNHSKLLCVMIGDGVQITGTAVVTIVFAAFGFMSPASRGMLLTGMIIFYLFLGTIAGYAAVRLWITIKGTSDGWRSVAWSVACFFPGICFVILTVLNFILWDSKSTRAIPISLYFVLLSLWFCISVPLTLLGEVSVVLTYMHLCGEDWQWWWKAFYTSGSIALYVFL
ncbi:hypothetical protein HYC85_014693 [Camellia sinensis]|uniref:Transmembrane 9 superfamily member n=1 Tax=Camellia sinensis TaxID=4442 RepID=A0A7J7HAD6_CAMSI|nr:hypothetical protein HYC85_014693 [Camellia sinensis]